MSTITLEKPEPETGLFPEPPPALPAESKLDRLRALYSQGCSLRSELESATVANVELQALRDQVESCEQEDEARKLLKKIADAEIEVKLKAIRSKRLEATEAETWAAAARIVPHALDEVSEMVSAATVGAWDNMLNASVSTIDPAVRAIMSNDTQTTARVMGAAETLASVQPGVARANKMQVELSSRRRNTVGVDARHHVTYAIQAIDFAFAEIPAIRAECEQTNRIAAALLSAVKSEF